jgi:hypothetical protein
MKRVPDACGAVVTNRVNQRFSFPDCIGEAAEQAKHVSCTHQNGRPFSSCLVPHSQTATSIKHLPQEEVVAIMLTHGIFKHYAEGMQRSGQNSWSWQTT